MQPETMTFNTLGKIGQVGHGEIDGGDRPGSTTERLAIGLALDALERTDSSFADDQGGAWSSLNASQRAIVRALNPECRKSKWEALEQ